MTQPEQPEADRVVYLEEQSGVLHYRDIPIIALTGLPRPWSGYGNRHVSGWHTEALWKLDKVRKELGEQYWYTARGQLFECLECRRWAIGRAWVFCSPRCRRAHRASQARERRLAAR